MEIVLASKVLRANAEVADENRARLEALGLVTLNLMSSPGSGKTSLLERTAEALGGEMAIGVVEGDIQTTRDAERIERAGLACVQIQTEGACHLSAPMVRDALGRLDLEKLALLFIENVGNLVCPAAFDLGETHRVVLASVPEGDDKPAKYPEIFLDAAAFVVNKTDLVPHTDCDIERLKADALSINPELWVCALSCRTGENLDAWLDWVRGLVRTGNAQG